MVNNSLYPVVEELNNLGLNKTQRREIIENLSDATKNHVASILELNWLAGLAINNHWEKTIDFTKLDLSHCLEIWDVALEYAQLINKSFKTISVSKAFHEKNNGSVNLFNNERSTVFQRFWHDNPEIETHFYFEDEANEWQIWIIDIWIPNTQPAQKISLEVSLWENYNINQANMDILALKNIFDNKNASDLFHKDLEKTFLKYTDRMTWLFNGKFVEEKLANPENDYSYIFIDVSCFKQINDVNWHDIWDKALMEVSKFLEESSRIWDKVCRVWGDEFAILFKSWEEDDIKKFIQRLESEKISIKNNNNKDVNVELKFWYWVKNYQSDDYQGLMRLANHMLNSNKDKKWAAYRFKSMLLWYDEETRIFSLWELIQDQKSLDYLLNAILTQPATQIFLDSFQELLHKFTRWELWEISQESHNSLKNFISNVSSLEKNIA